MLKIATDCAPSFNTVFGHQICAKRETETNSLRFVYKPHLAHPKGAGGVRCCHLFFFQLGFDASFVANAMTQRPIPAVGLANAILQILDFAIKCLQKQNAIYQPSGPEATPIVENAQVLQKIVDNLYRLTDAIDNSELKRLNDASKGKLSEPAQQLLKLSEDVKELTAPLIDALIATQAKGSFGDPRWGTAREALCNGVWKERDVTGLKKKLRAVRREVDVALLLALR